MSSFNSNQLPGLIVLEGGKVYDVNRTFTEEWHESKDLIGSNLTECMFAHSSLNGWQSVKSVQDVVQGQ